MEGSLSEGDRIRRDKIYEMIQRKQKELSSARDRLVQHGGEIKSEDDVELRNKRLAQERRVTELRDAIDNEEERCLKLEREISDAHAELDDLEIP